MVEFCKHEQFTSPSCEFFLRYLENPVRTNLDGHALKTGFDAGKLENEKITQLPNITSETFLKLSNFNSENTETFFVTDNVFNERNELAFTKIDKLNPKVLEETNNTKEISQSPAEVNYFVPEFQLKKKDVNEDLVDEFTKMLQTLNKSTLSDYITTDLIPNISSILDKVDVNLNLNKQLSIFRFFGPATLGLANITDINTGANIVELELSKRFNLLVLFNKMFSYILPQKLISLLNIQNPKLLLRNYPPTNLSDKYYLETKYIGFEIKFSYSASPLLLYILPILHSSEQYDKCKPTHIRYKLCRDSICKLNEFANIVYNEQNGAYLQIKSYGIFDK